ncbi:MAG TPA: type II toxin-antitoxin system Phd/YefM family antitoxin [Thermoanaerobaculia bacterium]|jgi:prevent-host-death family protein
MKIISTEQFEARCLTIIDEVKRRREPVVITRKGKPVARLLPVEDRGYEVFGCLAGDLEIVGDLDASVVAPSVRKGSR